MWLFSCSTSKTMRQFIAAVIFCISITTVFSQNGIIRGKVINELNNEPIPFANVVIQGTTIGVTTDIDGNFELKDLSPNLYNLVVSYIGFETKIISEIQVSNARVAFLNISLKETAKQLEAVEIKANPFQRTEESPISTKAIGTNEIQRYPGGNRDISRVIQSLPGVASTVAFRNDIIIRGGAPNENRFYVDDIETPVINHFSTQGASGGPVGIFNVDLIKGVDFYSGAFPANRGNTLSSLLSFNFIEGRTDRWAGRFTIGASEVALSGEGPTSKRSSLVVSARTSYLQFLFKVLGLPFLPTYNDFTLKHVVKFKNRSDFTILGIGAYDLFKLNLSRNKTDEQKYILEILPVNTQWNYTIGGRYRYFTKNGTMIFILSRNHLNNRAYKYLNNDESNPAGKISDYVSQEIENKFRFEHTLRKANFKINYGVNYEFATYTNKSFFKITTPFGIDTINYNSKINFNKYGFFAQISRSFFKEHWTLSAGVRADGMDFSKETANPFKQISPRFSSSFSITDFLKWNLNTGLYYQLPPYTTLGFRDNNGNLVNKTNGITYISCVHYVTGLQFDTKTNSQFSVEGFYKQYGNYPFLLRDSISLANLGGEFGVIGDEPALSVSDGRAYGVELFFQQKLFKGFFGIVSVTYVRSEFTGKNGEYIPSSWDNQYLVSLTFGKKFKRNWEIGWRWRLLGGTPYTPYDVAFSSLRQNWDVNRSGVFNYNQLNTLRNKAAHQLDIRVDKKYFFKKWNLNLYLDIQNAYNFKFKGQPTLVLDRDTDGNTQIENTTAPVEQQRYKTKFIENTIGTIIPSVGVVVEF
jgi:hypothetical protein